MSTLDIENRQVRSRQSTVAIVARRRHAFREPQQQHVERDVEEQVDEEPHKAEHGEQDLVGRRSVGAWPKKQIVCRADTPIVAGVETTAGDGSGIQLTGNISSPHMICQLPDQSVAYMTSRSTPFKHFCL